MPRPPIRPSPRAIAVENAAFLDELRRSGNADAAANAIGRHPTAMRRRRKRMPDFATEWRAALVVASALLENKQKARVPGEWEAAPRSAWRTRGGEPIVARGRGGHLQQRAATPNRLTPACEQAFLLALSVTANVGMAAAAAGTSKFSVYRRRKLDPGFAREWREALAQGYGRLELRCLNAADPASHAHDAWRHNEPPEPPPMTVNQMLQLMYLHQKEARLLAEPAHLKRRRGESSEAWSFRLSEMGKAERQRARERCRVDEAVRAARGQDTRFEWEQIALPDLAQVQAGRVMAKGDDPAAVTHDASRALFGGWRIVGLSAAMKGSPETTPEGSPRRRRRKR